MKIKKLKFKKEIIANLSDAESNQLRGGTDETGETCYWCGSISLCGTSCIFCHDETRCAGTSCCGHTYQDCSNMDCPL